MAFADSVYVLGLCLGAAGLAVRFAGRRAVGGSLEAPIRPGIGGALASAAPALLLFLVLHGVFQSKVHFLQAGDEYCRIAYSINWARDPYFATDRHLWPSGHFIILGSLVKLFRNVQLVVAATSLLGAMATVYFGAALSRRIWESDAAGFLGGCLVGSSSILLTASTNPQAEALFFPCFLASLDSFLAGWRARGQATPAGRLPRSELCFLRSAAWVAVGVSLRYEMWYVGIVLGGFLTARLLVFALSGKRWRETGILGLACLFLAAFPIAWLISNHRWHGSPFAFLQFAAQGNLDGNLFYDLSSPLRRFLLYPLILWQDHWRRLGLGFFGIVLALTARKKPAAPFVVMAAAVLLMAMLVCAKSGVGSNNRARYSEFLVLPLLCLGAGPLACLWSALRGWKMRAARTLVICFALSYALVSLRQARANYPNGWAIPVEYLALLQRLERERDTSRAPAVLIQPPGRELQVFTARNLHEAWMAIYHSNDPLKVREVVDPPQLERRLPKVEKGTHFLVKTPRPNVGLPAYARLLETIGTYELWEVTGARKKEGDPDKE